MTVCQETPPEVVTKTEVLAKDLDISWKLQVISVHLMGLGGPRHRGRWKEAEGIAFGGRD